MARKVKVEFEGKVYSYNPRKLERSEKRNKEYRAKVNSDKKYLDYKKKRLEHDKFNKRYTNEIDSKRFFINVSNQHVSIFQTVLFFVLVISYLSVVLAYRDDLNIRSPFDTLLAIGRALSSYGGNVIDSFIVQIVKISDYFSSANSNIGADAGFIDGIVEFFKAFGGVFVVLARIIYLLAYLIIESLGIILKLFCIIIGVL